jgi:hypothetical protein
VLCRAHGPAQEAVAKLRDELGGLHVLLEKERQDSQARVAVAEVVSSSVLLWLRLCRCLWVCGCVGVAVSAYCDCVCVCVLRLWLCLRVMWCCLAMPAMMTTLSASVPTPFCLPHLRRLPDRLPVERYCLRSNEAVCPLNVIVCALTNPFAFAGREGCAGAAAGARARGLELGRPSAAAGLSLCPSPAMRHRRC